MSKLLCFILIFSLMFQITFAGSIVSGISGIVGKIAGVVRKICSVISVAAPFISLIPGVGQILGPVLQTASQITPILTSVSTFCTGDISTMLGGLSGIVPELEIFGDIGNMASQFIGEEGCDLISGVVSQELNFEQINNDVLNIGSNIELINNDITDALTNVNSAIEPKLEGANATINILNKLKGE